LVAGPRREPDNKTDWSALRRSYYRYNFEFDYYVQDNISTLCGQNAEFKYGKAGSCLENREYGRWNRSR
jgi:hypothetical protein